MTEKSDSLSGEVRYVVLSGKEEDVEGVGIPSAREESEGSANYEVCQDVESVSSSEIRYSSQFGPSEFFGGKVTSIDEFQQVRKTLGLSRELNDFLRITA
jgi:hypothetical protein